MYNPSKLLDLQRIALFFQLGHGGVKVVKGSRVVCPNGVRLIQVIFTSLSIDGVSSHQHVKATRPLIKSRAVCFMREC